MQKWGKNLIKTIIQGVTQSDDRLDCISCDLRFLSRVMIANKLPVKFPSFFLP